MPAGGAQADHLATRPVRLAWIQARHALGTHRSGEHQRQPASLSDRRSDEKIRGNSGGPLGIIDGFPMAAAGEFQGRHASALAVLQGQERTGIVGKAMHTDHFGPIDHANTMDHGTFNDLPPKCPLP